MWGSHTPCMWAMLSGWVWIPYMEDIALREKWPRLASRGREKAALGSIAASLRLLDVTPQLSVQSPQLGDGNLNCPMPVVSNTASQIKAS